MKDNDKLNPNNTDPETELCAAEKADDTASEPQNESDIETTETRNDSEVEPESGDQKGGNRKKAVLAVAIAVVLVAGLGIAAVNGAFSPAPQEAKQEQKVERKVEKGTVEVNIAADGWAEGSSPFVAHIAGKASDDEKVDFHHAFLPDGTTDGFYLPEGEYELTWIAAVNADGSTYKTEGVVTRVKVKGGKTAAAEARFERIGAEAVTQADLDKTMGALDSALKSGDDTLTGENGKTVIEIVTANFSKAPNLDTQSVEDAKEQADAAANETSQNGSAATGNPSGNQSTGGSGGSSNAGGGTQTQASKPSGSGNVGTGGGNNESSGTTPPPAQPPAHTHNWVEQTTQQWVSNNVWVVDQAAWDEPVWTPTWICKCGASFSSEAGVNAHLKNAALSGDFNHSYSVSESITDYIHHGEVGHYEDQGYYETVVTGYKCGCGATK